MSPQLLIPLASSFGLSCGLTFAVRAGARRWGIVARPKIDRWHQQPTALLGGVALFLTVTGMSLVVAPRSAQTLAILAASGFLFAVGLVDDLRQLKPYQKLIGQVMGATLVLSSGLSLPWTSSPLLDMPITIFWLVGITNAINLLDNMDGLAAGIAAIAGVFLALCAGGSGHAAESLLLLVFAAALAGFLVYNFQPASIFMGDCGSMSIGFFLASAALLNASGGGRSRGLLAVLAVPVLILVIPIFDTTFVTLLRKLAGRAVSRGGRDHTSHRLVALGLSERRAVLMLYGLAILSGLLALLVRRLTLDVSLAAILLFSIGLTFLGIHLAEVRVYEDEELDATRGQPLVAFLVNVSYKRRVFEVLLDIVLILLAYYFANLLVFGPVADNDAWRLMIRTVPILVCVKLATFLATGVYRGLWRYIGFDSLLVFAKAVALGSLLSILVVLFAFRFQGFSRVVFVLDGLILLLLLAGSRTTFRLFRNVLPHASRGGRRVVIYGAGDAGELLLREIRNNRALQYVPVGFVDDDPYKKGKIIHGLKVLGGNGSLLGICRQQQVEEVLISSARISDERIGEILRACQEYPLTLKRMQIQLELLNG